MPRARVSVRSVGASILILILAAFPGAIPAQAATEQVTVHLYRVHEISCNEGDLVPCPNDYYPKAEIDHQGLLDGSGDLGYCCASETDFRTNWVFVATVDTAHNPVDIHLELWDQEDLSEDDVIHWVKTGDYLDLQFNLDTCIFTGGGLTAQQGAGFPSLAGESETGGPDSARGYFTITTPSCIGVASNVDSDGDGLPNAWETPGEGLDVNNDDTIDLALFDGPYFALPYHKDLFVEADYMAGDKPQGGALGDVIDAFARAPVDPLDGRYHGISLHVMEDEFVPTVSNIRFEGLRGPGTQDDFDDLKKGNPVVQTPGACSGFFGTAADRSSANCVNILEAKRQVFRYMIFADSLFQGNGTSGRAEWCVRPLPGCPESESAPQGGNDFIVTVGAGSFTAADFDNTGGRRNAEAATFMHEFGPHAELGPRWRRLHQLQAELPQRDELPAPVRVQEHRS